MENMRDELIEAAARALYEQFAADDFDNTYCSWDLLLGKHEWRQRAEPALDAILERMRDVDNDVLHAGYEAMFIDKWDGTQAPMMGAGWDAMLATLRSPKI